MSRQTLSEKESQILVTAKTLNSCFAVQKSRPLQASGAQMLADLESVQEKQIDVTSGPQLVTSLAILYLSYSSQLFIEDLTDLPY